MFPLPLPDVLAQYQEIQIAAAYACAIMLGISGILLTVNNVLDYTGSRPSARDKEGIRVGLLITGSASLGLIFGLYFLVPVVIAFFGCILYLLVKGIIIAFSRD